MALEFLVRNQRLKLFSGGPVVADSQQYLKARFTFSEDWQGTRKYAQFRRNGEVYTCDIDEYGEVEVPWETLVGKGVVQISAFATNQQDESNKLITTNPVFVKVETSGIKETELPKTPSLGILGDSVDESLKEITDARDRYVLQMTEIRDAVLEAKDHIDQTDYKIYVGETEPSEDITNAVVWINPAEDDGGSDELAEAVTAAQNAAKTAEKIATDLGLVDEAVQTAVSSAEQASNSATTASNKADIATAKADVATTKANEASTSADTATQKADEANTSATNAAQSYANADAIATQLTEYLATKETLTAPAVDKTLLIEGAAADSKVVGELKSDIDEIHSVIKSNELFDKSKVENGGLYLSGTGKWYESAHWWSTGLMPVGEGETIYVDTEYIKAEGFQWVGIREDGETYAGQGGIVTSEDGKSASFTISGNLIAFFRIGFSIETPQTNVSIRNTETIKYTIDMSVVDGLNESIDGLNESIDGLNERLENSHTKGINDIAWEKGYFINVSGVKNSNAKFRISEKIYVNKGDEIPYSLTGYNNVICVISAYDKDGNYISNKSIMYDASVGSGTRFVYSGTYIVESDVAYLIFCDWVDVEDSLTIPYKTDKLEDMSNRLSYVESAISDSGIVNQWKGMRISAFGTSITDTGNSDACIDPNGDPTGKYLPYLIEMGGFKELGQLPKTGNIDESKSNNFGIAGGKINGHILYYIRHYLDPNQTGANGRHGNNAELITIEGSVNDYASSVPLGQVGDTVPFTDSLLTDSTADGTFAGACYCAFTEALQYAPNAVVVYLTESTGKYYEPNGNNFHQGRLNSIGLKQIDYINMAKAVAEYVGIPVIDCGRDSMINAQNQQYLVDWIHHTYLGGKQYASCIWSKLKDIPCKVTSVD